VNSTGPAAIRDRGPQEFPSDHAIVSAAFPVADSARPPPAAAAAAAAAALEVDVDADADAGEAGAAVAGRGGGGGGSATIRQLPLAAWRRAGIFSSRRGLGGSSRTLYDYWGIGARRGGIDGTAESI
jgi:hypothetical protein